ncbi:hypothetical protein [Spirillospora sp. NPDC048819]
MTAFLLGVHALAVIWLSAEYLRRLMDEMPDDAAAPEQQGGSRRTR